MHFLTAAVLAASSGFSLPPFLPFFLSLAVSFIILDASSALVYLCTAVHVPWSLCRPLFSLFCCCYCCSSRSRARSRVREQPLAVVLLLPSLCSRFRVRAVGAFNERRSLSSSSSSCVSIVRIVVVEYTKIVSSCQPASL